MTLATIIATNQERHRTRVDKVNAELVTLTYGTIVAQLCKDFEGDYIEVNKQLDKMGYNIGLRLIEDYLAKSNTGRCANFRETAEMISKVCCPLIVSPSWLLMFRRSGSKCFLTSRRLSPIGLATISNFHYYLTRTL